MDSTVDLDTDVIVVGAGPTGLMLAGELRLGGARVLAAERLAAPTGQSRGLGFTARAMETFDQRGMLPLFGPLETSPTGHFGGVRFDYTVLRDAHFGARGIPQSRTEAALERWASGLGADILRGWEVVAFVDDGDCVEVELSTPEGTRTLRAAYLVGCDGGRSTVRERGGFAFPGTPATREMYLADVVGAAVRPRFLGERLAGGMVMAAPLTEGVDRIIVCEHGRPAGTRATPLTFAEVAEAWTRITGEPLGDVRADWVSSFTDATRQASEYRRGRVLLAGDAAHIHLPAGGQGLSTGVQDAANLGWKLAAQVRGDAPDGLLDSYHTERHAAGARLLMNTRAQGLIFLGGPELLGELMAEDATKRVLAGIVSGLDVRYDMDATTGLGQSETLLLGRRLPPRMVQTAAGPTTTTELLHPARGVLLDLADDAGLRLAAADHGAHVRTVTAVPTEPDAFDGATALLVRPDGYVAWAATASDPDPTPALRRWFGNPGPAPAGRTPPPAVASGLRT